MSIQKSIEVLASEFANSILETIRHAPLEDKVRELLGEGSVSAPRRGRPPSVPSETGAVPKKTKGERLPRRSIEDIEHSATAIIAFVRGKKGSVRAEEIRKALDIDKREWMRPLQTALSMGLKKSGEKRATVYSVSESAKPAKKSVKKVKSTKLKAKKPKSAKKSASKKTKKKVVEHSMSSNGVTEQSPAAVGE
jgi:hypothetical protein